MWPIFHFLLGYVKSWVADGTSQNIQSLIQLLFWLEILFSWVPTLILEEFGIHLRCLVEKLNVELTPYYLDIYVQKKLDENQILQ